MKKPLILFVAFICLILLCSGVVFSLNNYDTLNVFFRAGQIEKDSNSININDDIYFENKDFTIYENEINKIDGQYKLIGIHPKFPQNILTYVFSAF